MQLYRPRGFNDFFQDTFTFLKNNGLHFFKHYFIINGIFLLILLTISYFFGKFYTDFVLGSVLNPNSSEVLIDGYFNENFGLFILLLFVFFIVAITAGVISYAYTPIYFKLYLQNNGRHFETKEIINSYKTNLGRIFIFLICALLIAIPTVIGVGITSFILTITIIGILFLPFLMGLVLLFFGMTLMEYIEGKRGVWDSFGYSWSLLSSKFWPAIGAMGLFILMSYIIQFVINIFSSFFNTVNILTGIENGGFNSDEASNSSIVIALLLFVMSFLISTLLGNIIQIAQGVIFYGLKELRENIGTKDIIDQIGNSEN